jgi:hypothetical protein
MNTIKLLGDCIQGQKNILKACVSIMEQCPDELDILPKVSLAVREAKEEAELELDQLEDEFDIVTARVD